jgi:hypothetical protein
MESRTHGKTRIATIRRLAADWRVSLGGAAPKANHHKMLLYMAEHMAEQERRIDALEAKNGS